jgi:hypothetical protein
VLHGPVAKDRSRPFSRKHMRYWLTVTGGMILIGAINVALGFCVAPGPERAPEPIRYDLPRVDMEPARLRGAIDGGAAADATPSGS